MRQLSFCSALILNRVLEPLLLAVPLIWQAGRRAKYFTTCTYTVQKTWKAIRAQKLSHDLSDRVTTKQQSIFFPARQMIAGPDRIPAAWLQ